MDGRGSQGDVPGPSWSLTKARTVSLLALLVSCTGTAAAQAPADAAAAEIGQIQALLRKSSEVLAAAEDYRGTLRKQERFGDELLEQTIAFKFSRPFKVYIKYVEPHEGREVIYIRGSNKNKVRAHKGSVPDLPVSLSPFGRISMKGNHHPITSFGLESMLRIAASSIRKAIRRGDASIALSEGGMVLGHPTWRIEMQTSAGGHHVTVRASENLWELAERVGQDMYVILHHNEDIRSPRDVRPGQRVFVPRYYASRGQFFLSKQTHLMIKTVTWDHYGRLYERYEFSELELNPGLGDADFDYRNEDYEFVSR